MSWKYNPPKNGLNATLGAIQTILIVCMFFWFGWEVGLLTLLCSIDINFILKDIPPQP